MDKRDFRNRWAVATVFDQFSAGSLMARSTRRGALLRTAMLAFVLTGLLDFRVAAQGGSCSGCQTSTNGSYTVMTFNGSGTFTVSGGSVTTNYLAVAGGGGGGANTYNGSGGGGAGGMLTGSQALGAGTYAITVGSGGASGVSGSNSSLGTIVVATGGGAGGNAVNSAGAPGGSGGGGSGSAIAATAGGSGTTGQGYSGGGGALQSNTPAAGGGGGAGGVGGTAPNAGYSYAYGGNGGSGASSSISGSSVTYAGGGGGGRWGGSGTNGTGGSGIGGNASDTTGGNGAANTGSGGGGGGGGANAGGSGGSGVVIVSFLTPSGSTITGLAPAWGLVGQQVTITGSGFGSSQGTNTVKFNGVSAGTAPIWSATSITVSVPSGATTGSVVVTTGGTASNGMTFTVASSSGGVEPWVYGSGGAIYFTGGNVGIGTITPQNALSVNGIVQAKEVLVNTGWSDYVFAPGYYLAPLTDVAAYIKANQHLPGMPSAAEVEKNGVSVGGAEAKLLEKIEELTLHMIEAEQLNRELEQRLAQLEALAARKEDM